MDALRNIVVMFVVAIVAVALVTFAVKWFLKKIDDWSFPEFDFGPELKAGNQAVGVFLGLVVAAFILGLFLLAGKAVGANLDRYDDQFRSAGRIEFGYGTPWTWFKAQGMTESGLDPAKCSQVGACGVMQFMPGTAVAMGVQDRFEAKESIRAGVAYDRKLWGQFSAPRPPVDRLALTFSAYNWGIGYVLHRAQPCARNRFGGDATWAQVGPCLPPETQAYFPRIQRWQAKFARAVAT